MYRTPLILPGEIENVVYDNGMDQEIGGGFHRDPHEIDSPSVQECFSEVPARRDGKSQLICSA